MPVAAAVLLAALALSLAGAYPDDTPEPGWREGVVYEYAVNTRTLAGLDLPPSQVTGVLTRAKLRLQLDAGDKHQLNARVEDAQFARVHERLAGAWSDPLPSDALRWKPLPLRRAAFALRLSVGKVEQFIVERNAPLRDTNYLRGLASALQWSVVGSSAGGKLNMSSAFYPVKEESPMGECLTRYDVAPLPTYIVQTLPRLAPSADLGKHKYFMNLVKTIDFNHCAQPALNEWIPAGEQKFMGNGPVTRSASSRAIAAGHMGSFELHSVEASSRVSAGTLLRDTGRESVSWGRVNLTLRFVHERSSDYVPPPSNPIAASLVFDAKQVSANGPSLTPRSAIMLFADPSRSVSRFGPPHGDDAEADSGCHHGHPFITDKSKPCGSLDFSLESNMSGIPKKTSQFVHEEDSISDTNSDSPSLFHIPIEQSQDNENKREQRWSRTYPRGVIPPQNIFDWFFNYTYKNKPIYSRQSDSHDDLERLIRHVMNEQNSNLNNKQKSAMGGMERNATQVSTLETRWRLLLDDDTERVLATDPDFAGVKQLCQEQKILTMTRHIAQDMNHPGELVRRHVLQRFNELARLVRGCKYPSLFNITAALISSPMDQEKLSAWKTFRDATAAAGTGPSLVALRSWLDKGLISGWEARQVISTLPSAVRNPSPLFLKYFQARFVEDDRIRRMEGVNTTVAMTFSSLVYDAHTKGWPVMSYMAPLAREMRSAAAEHDSLRMQVYARALGLTGHPLALQAFNPFFNGLAPRATIFLRTTMVVAIQRVAVLHPKLTREMLYNIYDNEGEAYDVRVAAVYILMCTNPPLDMLQRMSARSHIDPSSQVSAAVRTSLLSAAKLTNPKLRELSRNARAVLALLMHRTQSLHYSRSVVKDYFVFGTRGMGYNLVFNYIGSHDHILPKMAYFGLHGYMGDLKLSSTQYAAMVSSVSKLISVLSGVSIDEEYVTTRTYPSASGFINMGPRVDEPLEGHLYFPLPGGQQFINFDKNTIHKSSWVLLTEALRFVFGKQVHNSKMYYDSRYSYSVPDITGHMTFFTFDELSLVRSTGLIHQVAGPINAKMSGGRLEETIVNGLRFNTNNEYARTMVSRLGFVCFFDTEPKRFVAAYDQEYQYHLPINVSAGVVSDNSTIIKYALYVDPSNVERKTFFQFMSSPYTARQRPLELGPGAEEEALVVSARKLREKVVDFGPNGGFRFNMSSEAEFTDMVQSKIEHTGYDFWSFFFMPIVYVDTQKVEASVTFDPRKAQLESIAFSVRCIGNEGEVPLDASMSPYLQKSQGSPRKSSNSQKNFGNREEKLEAEMIIHFNRKTATHLLRVKYKTDFTEKNDSVALHYVNRELSETHNNMMRDGEVKHELHLTMDGKWGDAPRWLFDEVLAANPTSTVSSKLTYAGPDHNKMDVDMECKLRRTPEREAFLQSDRTAVLCREQMARNNLLLPACVNVTLRAGYLDRYRCDARFERLPPLLVNATTSAYVALRRLFPAFVSEDPLHAGTRDRASAEVAFEPSFHGVNVSLRAPAFAADFTDLRMTRLMRPLIAVHPQYGVGQRLEQYFFVYQNEPKCVLDHNKVNTFDNRTYDVHLGSCWYNVSILSLMEKTKTNLTIQTNPNDNYRILRVLFPEGMKMEVHPSSGHSSSGSGNDYSGELIINGKSRTVYRETPLSLDLQYDEEHDIAVVSLVTKNLFLINLKRHEVRILYDGIRILVYAPNSARAHSFGLCGTFTGESLDDFKDPDGYVQREQRLFVASYADVREDCERSVKEDHALSKRVSRFLENIILVNVEGEQNVSRKAVPKRPEQNCELRRVDVVKNDTAFCFSQKLVLQCRTSCKPSRYTREFIKYHCISGSTATFWKSIVDQGANPDFSRKPANTYREKQVPVACVPP